LIFKKKNEEKELSDLIGGVISNESAVLACSINLMRAGNSAKKKSDPEMLLRVARASCCRICCLWTINYVGLYNR